MLTYSGLQLSNMPDQNRIARQVADHSVNIINGIFERNIGLDLGIPTNILPVQNSNKLTTIDILPTTTTTRNDHNNISNQKIEIINQKNISIPFINQSNQFQDYDPIDNWLAFYKLNEFIPFFRETLHIFNVSDLMTLKYFDTIDALGNI